MATTRYLTVDDLLAIHEREVGTRGTNRALLESAVGRPQQSAFGEDAYPGIHEKAAALFHSLVCNHPFEDGNKRTAVLALIDFYALNGYRFRPGEGDLVDLTCHVAEGRFDESLDELAQVLSASVTAPPPE